ncbi:hemin uptake protein HemP [Marilutibacter chinensis]|uniref:Hemin uptake protein HemP n=1 Tax=Marilutibacter chinensis TaxID=2912247 RepID=A0ABS9HWM1_9GAMM|nr:hemin uptake protein HemP [Lysobacter chinensis]MCF7222560.1 hemin uptake protein HemP [Lysobacter chinensis]
MSLRQSIAAPSAAVAPFPSRPLERALDRTPVPPRGALLDSDALLRGTREVLIRHGDEVYRLRHTRNDKLILTK